MTELQDAVDFLAKLVAYPTISSESNLEMIDFLANHLEKASAKVEIFNNPTGEKANLFATIGPETDGGIVLSGHTDVVPVTGQDWTSDPFEMSEKNGRLFGRGTCDMKGFIAACLAMAPHYASLNPRRPVHFAFTYDEEIGCFGAQALVDTLARKKLKPGIAIIGEPTSMRIIEGHKGCYEYTTRFTGLEGHGSLPDEGVNAVEYAARFINRLLELKSELRVMAPSESRFSPPWTTISTGMMSGGIARNVIAGKAEVEWEMRPVQPSDAQYVKSDLERLCVEELLPEMQAVSPEAGITTEVVAEVEGLEPATANVARDILTELTGSNATDLVAFGTEAGLYQLLGMDVVVCGPGSIEQAHKPDEYLALSQLGACLEMLEKLGNKLESS